MRKYLSGRPLVYRRQYSPTGSPVMSSSRHSHRVKRTIEARNLARPGSGDGEPTGRAYYAYGLVAWEGLNFCVVVYVVN